MGNTNQGIAAMSPERRAHLAAVAILFLLGVLVALVLAFATSLGHRIDAAQASVMGGFYHPKLTMLLVMLIVAVPMAPLYFPLRAVLLRRIRALPPGR